MTTDDSVHEKSLTFWGFMVSGDVNKNRGGIKVKEASEVMLTVFRNRKGYSLIEISLVLALIAVLVGGAFLLYNNRVAPATWSSSKYDTFNGVFAALNTCKNDRGGTYPAAAAAGSITAADTTTVPGALSPYVGSASADISTWTYKCLSAGTSALIAIVDSGTPSADAQGMLVNKINNSGNGALNAAISSGSVVTVTITGTTCS
ncbi:MAG TPA: prepilin-type N-terminal cleavage/methylation domain-containing protein [Dissulfurispiraceae bacterium]|nr:prepilin-type N-terminal cleavage/methylation domain-containing protein [Dissulfurispiraceae bacterium]